MDDDNFRMFAKLFKWFLRKNEVHLKQSNYLMLNYPVHDPVPIIFSGIGW